MSPRLRLGIAFVAMLLLGILAASVGAGRNRVPSADPRRSTFVTGPNGVSALATALERLGRPVSRFRRRVEQLPEVRPTDSLLAVFLDPSTSLTTADGKRLIGFARRRGDLLLAGGGAERAIACFGYRLATLHDSVRIAPTAEVLSGAPSSAPTGRPARVRVLLVSRGDSIVADSSDLMSGTVVTCAPPPLRRVDTLLAARGGRPAAVRLTLAAGGQVTLVADDGLFRNQTVRTAAAGVEVLQMLDQPGRHVLFDEYHHGFTAGGSLASLLWDWSWHSPWGWGLWQLAIVGLLVLLAGAVRFGPARRIIQRRRRSPLEHVRALATALAAAGGHDTAVRLLVRGLRRRLSRAGRPGPAGDEHEWLQRLTESVRRPQARAALTELDTLTTRPQNEDGVLAAATAVEEVWEDLKP